MPDATNPPERRVLQIEKIIPSGRGLARDDDGRIVFVPKVLPGSTVEVELTKRKKNFAESRLLRVITPAPQEVTPRCPHFFTCGGCSFQHMTYSEELELKESFVREAFAGIAKIAEPPLEKILPSPDEWHYRNKVEFTFGQTKEGTADIGYKLPGQFRYIFPVATCPIFDPRADELLEKTRVWLRSNPAPVYVDEKIPGGVLQYLMVRRSVATGDLLLNLIIRDGVLPQEKMLRLGEAFIEQVGQRLSFPVASVVLTMNRSGSYPQRDKDLLVLRGNGQLVEKLFDLSFTVSPFSFFQTNTHAAEVLYGLVLQWADLQGTERVLDFYCGTGTIGQTLARAAREVIGIELLPEAIDDAMKNAEMNGITNCSYTAGDVRALLKADPAKYAKPDLLVVDPPRDGLHPKALARMLSLEAQRIVYVSCNAATQARDTPSILAAGYTLTRIRPVDQFPHTPHVESVALFERG